MVVEHKKDGMNNTLFALLLTLGIMLLAFLIYLYYSCPNRPGNCVLKKNFIGATNVETKKATVYFTEDISPEGLEKLLQPYLKELTGNVGVKVHFGDDGNKYFVKPSTKTLF